MTSQVISSSLAVISVTNMAVVVSVCLYLVVPSTYAQTSLLSLSSPSSSLSYTRDLTLRYFSDAELLCDHPQLKVVESQQVESIYWILPDGSLVDPMTSQLDPHLYSLRGHPERPLAANFNGFNLTVLAIDDHVFGYYTCVILFATQGSNPIKRIAAIRLGLNVDGADFSYLLDEYKHNAIVGGIAAGALLILMVVAILVWYFRCHEKLPEIQPVDQEKGVVSKLDYHNSAFQGEKSVKAPGSGMEDSVPGDSQECQETNSRL